MTFEEQLIDAMPHLQRFALRLTGGNLMSAEDLVQDTMLKALEHKHQYVPETSIRAWLYTILRNTHFTTYRNTKRLIFDGDEAAMKVSVNAPQIAHCDLQDTLRNLDRLSFEHQWTIMLASEGFTQIEIERITRAPIGTVKSRIFRAREQLEKAR